MKSAYPNLLLYDSNFFFEALTVCSIVIYNKTDFIGKKKVYEKFVSLK